MRGDAISLRGSTLVRIWFVFPTRRIKVPYSLDFGRFARPVAVIDNDGQADIVVISNAYAKANADIACVEDGVNGQSGVRVFGTAGGKWVRTRRVWNQHAYYVTNVMSMV